MDAPTDVLVVRPAAGWHCDAVLEGITVAQPTLRAPLVTLPVLKRRRGRDAVARHMNDESDAAACRALVVARLDRAVFGQLLGDLVERLCEGRGRPQEGHRYRSGAAGLGATGFGAFELCIVELSSLVSARPADLRRNAEELHERRVGDPKQSWTDLSREQSFAVDPVENRLVADVENARDIRRRVQGLLLECEVVDARRPGLHRARRRRLRLRLRPGA